MIRGFFGWVLSAFLCVGAVWAAPPRPNTQVPGYFRVAIGDMTATALYDGTVRIGNQAFTDIAPQKIEALLADRFLPPHDGVQTAINAYLVQSGPHLILVDAGSAACFGPTAGHILDALEAAGYRPQDVDTVLITHMHPDHICGLSDGAGKAVFPNAVVWASSGDADFWLAPEKRDGMFKMAQDALAPYRAAKAFRTFKDGDEILPGVEALASPGHTPGHTSFLFVSKGIGLLVWGDIVHSYALQFSHPEVGYAYDTDRPTAVASRQRQMRQAAEAGWMVGGAHLPFPGLGHVAKVGAGFAWVPVEYAPLP